MYYFDFCCSRNYKNCVRQKPGFQLDNLEWMKSEAERRSLPSMGYRGGLLIDEMSVQDDLQVRILYIDLYCFNGTNLKVLDLST